MSRGVRVEVCCESLADAKVAQSAGADRIELNSALRLGGLTPSAGLTSVVCQDVQIPVIAMIRPRESGFCYSDNEFNTMLEDARMQLDLGATGLAFGILTAAGDLDISRSEKLINLTKDAGAESVFHRAFDFISDWRTAIDQCIELGINRIMTSGANANAIAGIMMIREVINYADDRIEVLPAAGISPGNVRQLIAETGCLQVHGSFSETILDPTTAFFDQSLVDLSRDSKSYRATSVQILRDLITAIGD